MMHNTHNVSYQTFAGVRSNVDNVFMVVCVIVTCDISMLIYWNYSHSLASMHPPPPGDMCLMTRIFNTSRVTGTNMIFFTSFFITALLFSPCLRLYWQYVDTWYE